MKLRFWGVRGSIPVPGPDTVRYGGNTSCYEVVSDDGQVAILDAGTGIRPLGKDLVARGVREISLLISHTHHDHIHGFPFFLPGFISGTSIHVHGPIQSGNTTRSVFEAQMSHSVFPVSAEQLLAKLSYQDHGEEVFDIPGFKVRSCLMNHPVTDCAYRLEADGRSIVYTGDHERFYKQLNPGGKRQGEAADSLQEIIRKQNQRILDFVRDADLLVIDSTYLASEYPAHIGWGHSTVEMNIELAIQARVRHLALTHHDVERHDDALDAIAILARRLLDEQGGSHIALTVAREGLQITL